MPLSPDQLQSLSRWLDELMDLGQAEREVWFARLPGDQQELANTLREVLAERGSTRGEGFLNNLPELRGEPGHQDSLDIAHAGDRVGPYRLIREIGRGGMGAVWLAERADGNFKRQVALKLPRLAWGSGLAERMAREREIGAMLEHPNIARLYDAGVDELGRPYIAMEYIDGKTIEVYCRDRQLPVRERLKLLMQVARAVAYAHGRLIVHRDLKPSNVLVSEDGQIHLLDFGIAKLLDDAAEGQSALTQEQGRVLTPRYAAPEQIKGEPVTVQTDVHGLGVLAFEVLTGTLPYGPLGAKAGPSKELEQQILQGYRVPASRQVEDPSSSRQLQGDLDAVLGKALKVEPQERYRSADALADDIQNWLESKPVAARPDGVAYRIKMAARRHWVGLGASVAVASAAVAGAALFVVQNQRAAQAASRERLITEFVSDVFRINQSSGTSTGDEGRKEDLRGDAFLRATAPLVDQRFAQEPEMQAKLYGVVTRQLLAVGAGEPAIDYAKKNLALLERMTREKTELFAPLLLLAEAYQAAFRFGEAEAVAIRALELAGKDTARRVDALSMLARATMWLGNSDEAIRLAEEVEDLAKQLTQTPISLAWAHSSRGSAWVNKDDDDNYLVHWAEWHEKGINLALRLQGADSVAAADMRYLYGSQMARQPSVDISKAREVLSASYEARRRIGGTAAVLADVEQPGAWNWLYRRRGASTEEVRAVLMRAQRTTASSPLVPDFRRADSRARSNEFEAVFGNLAAAWPTLLEDAERAISSKRSPYQKTLVMWHVVEVARRKGEHAVAGTWLERQRKLGGSAGNGLYPHWMTMADASNLSMAGKSDQALKHFETLPVPAVSGQEEYRSIYRWSLARLLADSGRYAQAIDQLRGELPLRAAAEAASADSQQVLFGELMCRVGDAELGFDRLDAVLRYSIEDRYPHTPEFAWVRGLMALCALKLGDKARARDLAARAEESFEIQPSVSPYFKRPLAEYRRLTASQKKR